jgi:hypothetical protein
MAKGILDDLRDTDEGGVGTPRTPPYDLGVETPPGTKVNLSFSFPMEAGKGLSSIGVGGCSAELAVDIEVVKLGVEF